MSIHVEEIPGGRTTCPYCRCALLPTEPRWSCPRCATTLHTECLKLNEGCTSLGCEAAADPVPERPARRSWRFFPLSPRTERVIGSIAALLALIWVCAIGVWFRRSTLRSERVSDPVSRPEPKSMREILDEVLAEQRAKEEGRRAREDEDRRKRLEEDRGSGSAPR